MKVIFVKDQTYDAYMIWEILHDADPAGIENRARYMRLNPTLLDKINGTKTYDEVSDLLKVVVAEKHTTEKETVDQAIHDYQLAWDKIDSEFSSEIERITETPWKFPEYKVVVGPFHPGVSSRGGNTVARWCYEDPEVQKRITAHELTMNHLWSIIDAKFPEAKSDNGQESFWALNEISTVCLLGFEPNLNKLWSSNTQGTAKFLQNYPQLKNLKQALEHDYLAKNSFSNFLGHAKDILLKHYKSL